MEYLPENPNDLEEKNKAKTEKKLKDFREYIVDKGVVLAIVKVLISLKYAEEKPKNPIKSIRDFFGNYKDPRWDEMKALNERIIILTNENQQLLEQAIKLEDELKNKQRGIRIDKLFDTFELDKNGLMGSKMLIEKLTGNKKFEADEKIDKNGFINFIVSISEKHSKEENELLSKIELALQGETVFKEDLENPLYLKITEYFKELKKNNKEAGKNK